MHNISQAQSKWLVEEIRANLSLNIKDKLSFAALTPQQVADKLADKFGVSVNEEQIMIWARFGKIEE